MKQDNELFVKQMTRKEFLQFAVLAILGVFGFKNFITYLLQHQERQRLVSRSSKIVQQPASNGFGSRKFGA